MSTVVSRFALALLAIMPTVACDEEPLSPASAEVSAEAMVSGGPRDRSAIQEIVTTFDEAWTDGDPVRYAAQYAGAEWVGPDGTILTDPAAITQLYQFVIGVLFPGTTRESTIRHLTFLTGTVAVLDISTQVTGAGGVVLARALEKNILIKRGGVWSIVQHQQVLVAPVS